MTDKITHEVLPIGHTFRYDGYKYHVVGIFTDDHGNDDGCLYVVKYYGKHKQWWHYEVWSAFDYDLRIRHLF